MISSAGVQAQRIVNMDTKDITIQLSESLLGRLSSTVYLHANQLECKERWSEDRDKSREWKSIADEVSHLAYCKYRKIITKGNPIDVILPKITWKLIQNLLIKNRNHLIKPHPIYTKIYPEQIKDLKKRGEVKLAEDLKSQILLDKEKRRNERSQINEILQAIKEK